MHPAPLQGLYLLLEDDALVTCRKKDAGKVRADVPAALKQMMEKTGITTRVVLREGTCNSDETLGGVVLSCVQGKKTVTNTLAGRLRQVAQEFMPELRATVFGSLTHNVVV
ncbi:hypothetical protein HPB52_003196 [Rhipicephalus sanguineus]|uniref:Uncharacterized protein n=1 Tax=Rhipicephalus sanguineus TaxID=34632 RepID=A0A9D4PKG7_RHISA|nr:hypothetical protein HPB52_003196 [Rhipicephalus sanguineus]